MFVRSNIYIHILTNVKTTVSYRREIVHETSSNVGIDKRKSTRLIVIIVFQ